MLLMLTMFSILASLWVSLNIERSSSSMVDKSGYRSLVNGHGNVVGVFIN